MRLQEALTKAGIKFSIQGDEVVTFCPRGNKGYHKRKKKLYINETKGFYFCFQCDGLGRQNEYKGNSLRKVLRDLGIDPDVVDGSSERKIPFGDLGSIISGMWGVKKEETNEGIELPQEYSTDWESNSYGRLSHRYLIGRGLSEETISRYEFGYCATGDYKGYIIIPFYENSQLAFYQARGFLPHLQELPYRNPPKRFVVGKSKMVFGIDRIKIDQPVVITEGVFDAIAIRKNTVAILGKKMSKFQMEKLLDKGVKDVIIFLDEDALEEAQQLGADINDVFDSVKIARLRKYKDAGMAPRKRNLLTLRTAKPYEPQLHLSLLHKKLQLLQA